MKAAIASLYCRVSTENQEREGTSLDTQVEACLAKASELNYQVPQEFIFRESYSGLTMQRPRLTELRGKAQAGGIDSIIVYTPDRLARVGEDILALVKEFKASGVKLLFVKEQWEDTLNGKMVAFMLGWAAEAEAMHIKERTTRAKAELVKQGILPQGTGLGLYGYRWDKETKKRIAIGLEARVVERVFNMIAEGVSRFNVAKTLNDQGIPTKSGSQWHPLTIGRMITNSAYIGLTYFGRTSGSKKTSLEPRPKEDWKLLPDVTPPIVSKELYNRAQKALKHSKELRPGRPKHNYLLAGHIKCGLCNSPLVGSCINRGRYRYYICRGTYSTAIRNKICNAHYIKADTIEEIVWDEVRKVLENPGVVFAEIERQAQEQSNSGGNLNREITKLRRKVRSYDIQQKRLVSLFRHGEFSEDFILDEMNRLNTERQEDGDELGKLTQAKQQLARLSDSKIKLNEFCERVRQNLARCTFQDRRLALDALGLEVTATSERIDIKGYIPIEATTTQSSGASLTTAQTSA